MRTYFLILYVHEIMHITTPDEEFYVLFSIKLRICIVNNDFISNESRGKIAFFSIVKIQ